MSNENFSWFSRPSSTPDATQPASFEGRSAPIIEKGVGSLPTAESLGRVIASPPPGAVPHDAGAHASAPPPPTTSVNTVWAHGGAASSSKRPVPASSTSASPSAAPAVYLIFLLGPGCDTFRHLVEDAAPMIDAESGSRVHWIVLGDPRASQDEFRSMLASRGVDLDELLSQWRALLNDRGAERNAIAVETMRAVTAFGIGPDTMPLVIVTDSGATDAPMRLPLPVAVIETPGGAREILRVLREGFRADRVLPKQDRDGDTTEEPRTRMIECALAVGRELDRLVGSENSTPISGPMKKMLAVYLVRHGWKIKDAAKKAGITPQAINKDPPYRELMKRARAEARGGAAGSRAGSVADGRPETASDHDEDSGSSQEDEGCESA